MTFSRRASWSTVLAGSALILTALAGRSSALAAPHGDPSGPLGQGSLGQSSIGPVPEQDGPIIGAAVTILADGTAPWEDRPFTVAGLGSLPGSRGVPDPGDDVGPTDQVVRSWDAVVYRAAFSVRGGTAEDVVAEVALTGPATWEPSQLGALRLSGCPGGAALSNGGQLLRCNVGRVQAPPAVTVALDLTARVRGSALQGDTIDLALAVRSSNATADPDPANCPLPGTAGCDANAPQVSVSAAPAGELRKSLMYLGSSVRGGVVGREMGWLLEAVVGADGDVRGSSDLIGGPWQMPDWWRATANSRTVALTVSLVGCTDLDGRSAWTCAQPGGPGTAVDVTLAGIDVSGSLPNGVGSTLPQVVARGQIVLWVPEEEVLDAPADVTFTNCYATERGHADRTLWMPSDSRGQPNLGGRAEPAPNNCSYVVLAVPQPTPAPRVPPYRPPRRGNPGRGRPPVIRPTPTPAPQAVTLKRYTPYTQGEAVTDGSAFAAEVRVQVSGGGVMAGVIACDKWDNSTHTIRDASTLGARAWIQQGGAPPRLLSEETEVVLEYATGNWGRRRPPQISLGRAWYQQSMASCADNAPVPGAGWVADREVDFTNQGGGQINAEDVNMVRARFVSEVPAGTSVWLEVMFTAKLNSPGTWLMNYAASRYGTASRASWQVAECYGAVGSSTRRECPIPAENTRSMPGSLGDMLVHVGVPVWITKRTDPVVPGGSPVVNAGDKAAFAVQISTFPRPADPPPPVFPPEALAPRVIVTDTLPWSLVYEPGSATIASEDLNANGRLEPGEDRNGNGRIDRNVAFEPNIQPLPNGETAIGWPIGDLPFRVRVPEIRYETRVSRLVRGGTAVTNQAGVHTSREPAPDCRPGARELEGGRCAWAQIVVANIAAAQVEKVPARPVVFSGEDLIYRLALANLTNRPVEWFDAVDILPRAGEPRAPATRLSGPWSSIAVNMAPGGAPLETWVSASDPVLLDTFAGGPLDGLVDPVAGWGGPGAGLGGAEWPCRLADVGRSRCPSIPSPALVTALRFWGPDPRPSATGSGQDSFLPAGSNPRLIDVVLQVPGSQPEDIANNAWGGRFESLPLPVFDDALIRVRGVDTPTPTVTPTPLDTPTPTTTSTATPRPIFRAYLPSALHVPCLAQAVDVVLVVDASSSMRRAAGDGGTKHEAVLRAAHGFLDRFELGDSGHRVAVVAFNHRAWLAQGLTSDRALLDHALNGLPGKVEEGTRLDLGLLAGADALGAVAPGQVQAMVFLTDGLPNRVPTPQAGGSQNDTVLAAAAEVRGRGISIHTVGYGRADAPDVADRILPELLIAIAGSPAGYHETDDAGELALVFRRLALDVSCAVQRVWP